MHGYMRVRKVLLFWSWSVHAVGFAVCSYWLQKRGVGLLVSAASSRDDVATR